MRPDETRRSFFPRFNAVVKLNAAGKFYILRRYFFVKASYFI